MTIREIANEINAWAPPPEAESYDNVGLLVGYPETEVSGILINLDVTEAMLVEAKKQGANLIITHHPIWFGPRNRLNGEDYVSRIIMSAIKHDIALFACHTNLDNIQSGVNRRISEKLGLNGIEFLRPKMPDAGLYGSGMIGELPAPVSKSEFLAFVKDTFRCGTIRYADSESDSIRRVAVCGGSGSFLLSDAIRQKADAMITGDVSYHKFFDSEGRILYMDIGHYESEQFTSELIYDFLSEKFPNFAIHLSKVHTNPIKYY
jgi:dinuclear metal center YbgI/SA1388 family protein